MQKEQDISFGELSSFSCHRISHCSCYIVHFVCKLFRVCLVCWLRNLDIVVSSVGVEMTEVHRYLVHSPFSGGTFDVFGLS